MYDEAYYFDGDTGEKQNILFLLLERWKRNGISAVIIEDKVGLKKNSLFGTDAIQLQDSIENFLL